MLGGKGLAGPFGDLGLKVLEEEETGSYDWPNLTICHSSSLL